MSSAVRQGGGVGRCEQRLTSGLPKPITAPCGSLAQLAAPQRERGQRSGRALPALRAPGRLVSKRSRRGHSLNGTAESAAPRTSRDLPNLCPPLLPVTVHADVLMSHELVWTHCSACTIMSHDQQGATMDVGGWLRGLGLGQFEATFRESEIDFDVLPELTEPDLEKLGVPLGHRKRLLKAIASLGATAALGPAPAQSPTAQAIAPPTPETAGERRHVTVMFCDLVDFDLHRGTARRGGMA